MRIASITITNFGPHRHLSLPLAPLTVITGGNGTGKSSIAEALRLALTGDWLLRGLTRKQDRAALLSDGAEAGSITVEGDAFRAAVNIKTGKVERTPGPTAYLEQCCDPRLIVDQPTADLRAMLLDLLQIDINRVGMQAELIARGHDPDRVGAWACGQDCATAASEARGAWKAATGLALTDEAFRSTVLVLWRNKLRTSEAPQRIFDAAGHGLIDRSRPRIRGIDLEDRRNLAGELISARFEHAERRRVSGEAGVDRELVMIVRIISGRIDREAAGGAVFEALIHRQDDDLTRAAQTAMRHDARDIGLRAGIITLIIRQDFLNRRRKRHACSPCAR